MSAELAQAGYNTATYISDFFADKEQGKIARESIDEQIRLINQQRNKLVEAYKAKGEIVRDIYGTRIQSTKDIFAENLKRRNIEGRELNLDIGEAAGRTNLAYSGTMERRGEMAVDKFRSESTSQRFEYRSNLGELANRLRSEEFQIGFEREQALSNIDIKLASLEGQRRAAEAQENKKFLGIFNF